MYIHEEASPVSSGNKTDPNICSTKARQWNVTVASSASSGQLPKVDLNHSKHTLDTRPCLPGSGSRSGLPRNSSTRARHPSKTAGPITGLPRIANPSSMATPCKVIVISLHGRWKQCVLGLHRRKVANIGTIICKLDIHPNMALKGNLVWDSPIDESSQRGGVERRQPMTKKVGDDMQTGTLKEWGGPVVV